MARRWTPEEEDFYREQLLELYVNQNMSIGEISPILGITYKAVFDRLKRLGIPTNPKGKFGYANMDRTVRIPLEYSNDLAEFFGIMLGDGNLTPTQVCVTLGNKESSYAHYVSWLLHTVFNARSRVREYGNDYHTVYFGSVTIVRWLEKEGMVRNKVAAQVGVPDWIFTRKEYMQRFLRGFFDTDGSIYKLRFGMQISLTNCSFPILYALQDMARRLGYRVSEVSVYSIYITKRTDVERFFAEIRPMNAKHQDRFDKFRVGGRAVNCSGL